MALWKTHYKPCIKLMLPSLSTAIITISIIRPYSHSQHHHIMFITVSFCWMVAKLSRALLGLTSLSWHQISEKSVGQHSIEAPNIECVTIGCLKKMWAHRILIRNCGVAECVQAQCAQIWWWTIAETIWLFLIKVRSTQLYALLTPMNTEHSQIFIQAQCGSFGTSMEEWTLQKVPCSERSNNYS